MLLIDDHEDARTALELVLESEGHAVVTAADADIALAHIRGGLAPGIVLLDLGLPGMSARSFCEAMRADARLADAGGGALRRRMGTGEGRAAGGMRLAAEARRDRATPRGGGTPLCEGLIQRRWNTSPKACATARSGCSSTTSPDR